MRQGNGVADDTTAIKNAMNAVAAIPYSTLYFPAGTYIINSTLTLPSNVQSDRNQHQRQRASMRDGK